MICDKCKQVICDKCGHINQEVLPCKLCNSIPLIPYGKDYDAIDKTCYYMYDVRCEQCNITVGGGGKHVVESIKKWNELMGNNDIKCVIRSI